MIDQKAQVNLWRESWAACKQNLRGFLPSILGIGILLIICDFYYLPDQIHMFMEQFQAALDNPGGPMPVHVTPTAARMANGTSALIDLLGLYYFTVFYLRRAPINSPPELGTDSFFTWLGQVALSALCVLGISAATLAIVWAAGTAAISYLHADAQVMAAVLAATTIIAPLYGAVKFTLAGPLALARTPMAFKRSWQLTQGNWWRLFWHYMMVVSVAWMWLILILFVPLMVVLWMVPVTPDSPLVVGVFSVVMGLSVSATLACTGVFCCEAARVLGNEERGR